jgi:REP element-mobilizing transposase RayT
MPDHVHMLVSIPPKYSVSQFMGYLKGKSALMMFDRHANLKYKVNGRKPAYWYRYGRNDKIQRDAFVNASPWIHYFGYYHHIIVRLAMLSGAL